ncbi:hypothetical protein GE107_15455 [Cohnella sp. CFH 77786]|uniref:WGxxGxxG family protein n=1 Tax=Cohnella sp. CFH 77786 TaxID=2662265 RepID=UPI001EB5E09D|nr:WGxxGxxG family protein [Cohnella sp. CFH 77786]MBW5447454.1 hypothetical protein [Cohnella sp. CFH 77786]
MNRQITSGLMVASVSLMLAVPAFAHGTTTGMTATTTGTGTYAGTGTTTGTTYTGTGVGVNGMNRPFANDGMVTNRYGTYGTTTYTNDGITNRYGVNNYTGYNTTVTDGRYRTRAATTNRNYNWGWLGLLGLIGLAGMRGRNPERDRR